MVKENISRIQGFCNSVYNIFVKDRKRNPWSKKINQFNFTAVLESI